MTPFEMAWTIGISPGLSKKFDEERESVPEDEWNKWLNLLVNTPKKERKRLDREALCRA